MLNDLKKKKKYKDSKLKLLNFKGAEATCVESITETRKCFRLKDMLYFDVFSAHMNMFWQHYLENKKLKNSAKFTENTCP